MTQQKRRQGLYENPSSFLSQNPKSTECSPVTLYTRYDKVRSNGEVKTEEEKNLTIRDPVLFGAKDTNVPVSSVLLYYDDNNRLKKAAVMINGPDNRVSIIMSV